MLRLLTVFLLCCGHAGWAQTKPSPPASSSSSNDRRMRDIEQRMAELEKQNAEFQAQWLEGRGQAKSFFNNPIFIGGFFESAVTSIDGPNTESQTSANSHILGLNIAASLAEQFRFVTQVLTGLSYSLQNPHNNPNLTPSRRQYSGVNFGAIVAQAYVEYHRQPALRVQGGLGYAPFGHAFQQRELVLFKRRSGPQMINSSSSSSVGIAFPLWMGVHVFGAFPLKSQDWGYNVYTFSPFNNPKTLGLGSRLWLRSNTGTTVGLSGQEGKDGDENFTSHGLDINTKMGRYGLTGEYAQHTVTGQSDSDSYYVEPFMTFHDDSFLIFAVFDYLNNSSYTSVRSGTSIQDPYKRWNFGGGVNWLPTPYVRLRLTGLLHRYQGDTAEIAGQKRDYQSLDLSAGITF